MTTTFIALSLAGAPVVGFIAGWVVDHIHKAAAPRVVRLHGEDRAWLESIEYQLSLARIRAQLVEMQGWR